MKTKIVILICCFSLFATASNAENVIPGDITLFTGYNKEGEFVGIPARCGWIIGLPVGMIVSLPVALVGTPFGKFEEVYFNLGGVIIPQSFSFITGLPFYATKKVFYDFPRALSERERTTVH